MLQLACTHLKSGCKGDLLNRFFVGDLGLLLLRVLLLELGLVDSLEALALSKLLRLEDLVGIGDEFGHLDLDLGAVDVEGLALVPPSVVLSLNVNVVELFVDEGLGKVVGGDNLANGVVLEKLHLLRAADATSEREDTALAWVRARRRVGDAKRAVDAVAVMERRILGAHVLIVARVAHVVGAEAAEKRNGAAVHALPVDLDAAVRLT